MNWKLACVGLVIGASFLAVAGCAADATTPEGEEAAVSQDELTSSRARLVGAFHQGRLEANSVRPPTFEGIVFQADGSFFADLDTGIRCVTAPCPSHVRLTGRFTATRSSLRLIPAQGESATDFHGRYDYSFEGDKLSLSRAAWEGWTNGLDKELSYCAQPVDCAGQGLFVPACAGSFTCGDARSCGFSCDGSSGAETVWPTDRKTLVAETAGGGFTPPPAPGSTCGVGAQKYTLDIAARKLAWEVCSFQDWSTPMHMESGSRTLTRAELATVDAAMNAVSITTEEICGADKPFLSISVTSTSQGTKTYADSFYSCMGDHTYVDNIDGVFAAFRELAH
jgi:hypothetical protein